MPYDPNYPPTNVPLVSAPMRAQFGGLEDLIDALPSIGSAVVDAVNTLPPGRPVAVCVSVIGNTLHFTFDIPLGAEGSDGADGEITHQTLDDSFSTSSSNSNGVDVLSFSVSAPPFRARRRTSPTKLMS